MTHTAAVDTTRPEFEYGRVVWFDAKHGCGMIARDKGGEAFLQLNPSFDPAPVTEGRRLAFRLQTCERLGREVAAAIDLG